MRCNQEARVRDDSLHTYPDSANHLLIYGSWPQVETPFTYCISIRSITNVLIQVEKYRSTCGGYRRPFILNLPLHTPSLHAKACSIHRPFFTQKTSCIGRLPGRSKTAHFPALGVSQIAHFPREDSTQKLSNISAIGLPIPDSQFLLHYVH